MTAFLGLLHSIANAAVELQLLTNTQVNTPVIMLGQLVEVLTTDTSEKALLQQLMISEAPLAGQSKTIARLQIQAQLEKANVLHNESIHWQGPLSVKVKTKATKLTRTTILKPAYDALYKTLSEEYSIVNINEKSLLKDLLIPDAPYDLRVRLAEPLNPHRRMCVWVDIHSQSVLYQSVPIWFEVKIKDWVYVARHDLDRGQHLSTQQFLLEQKDITLFPEHLNKASLLEGNRLRLSVKQGDVLTRRSIEVLPAVSKGEKLKVMVSQGAVVIHADAEALSDGQVGDYIDVKNIRSGLIYQVRVTGDQLAVVGGRNEDNS
ncbi:MAG: flagellar basal body P-ring formation chaperone FlgA [Gammaproteobacteria bacterium]|nr:flagellar basal body P-ring formation chaperone FlgA [Gammaproteobacteria bacterium]